MQSDKTENRSTKTDEVNKSRESTSDHRFPTDEQIKQMASTPFPPIGQDPYGERASGWIN